MTPAALINNPAFFDGFMAGMVLVALASWVGIAWAMWENRRARRAQTPVPSWEPDGLDAQDRALIQQSREARHEVDRAIAALTAVLYEGRGPREGGDVQ